MELRHLQRAFDFASDRSAAIAVLQKHGGKNTPDSVPAANIDAATTEMRALGSRSVASSSPKTIAELDVAAIYSKWNGVEKTG